MAGVAEYLRTPTLSQVTAKPTILISEKSLWELEDDFFSRGSFKVGNGQNT
jgi:hypothetical protein